MSTKNKIHQHPGPGSRKIMFRGDTVTFTLSLDKESQGKAWVRTNIGHASIARKAVIDSLDRNLPLQGTEWFDIPMRQVDSHHFSVMLPLSEVGHFEAKCFFMSAGKTKPLWPEGDNITINVEPADSCCANIIYNAFVRQFGKNKNGQHSPDDSDKLCILHLDKKEYTVIPRSGTFRDLIAELDFIVGKLGCRFVHLLPISPTPTTYGRMGRFGSPYAALHFTGIDPALAEFDIKATPLEQFGELLDAIHARKGKLMIDIAVNHTGWAASLHETHPHWLLRDHTGDIRRPGAWGVVWQDLTSLDYSQQDLWKYIAHVFLTWCRRGVDGFRCDAGYMIPLPAWTYIITRVREQFPETIFLLEGLGGRISVTRDLLNHANFNWAYSELFQNDDRIQIENYLPEAIDISNTDGIAVHYAETHDNNRLASRSRIYARMRTALCALCSHQGAFGFANGVEWFADKKISVHEAHPLNWGSAENQVDHIRRLNILLRSHPVFFEKVDLKLIQNGEGNVIVLLRRHVPSGKKLVIVANLDDKKTAEAIWVFQADMAIGPWIDLLTERKIEVITGPDYHTCKLSPGEVLCLTVDEKDLDLLKQPESLSFLPERLLFRKLKAKAMEVFCFYHGTQDISDFDLITATKQLSDNPVEFCRSFNPDNQEHRVIFWQWPRDLKREVILPPGHFLLVKADNPFRATIIDGYEENKRVIVSEESLPQNDGTHFLLFTLCKDISTATHLTLRVTVYEGQRTRHEDSSLLFLTETPCPESPAVIKRNDLMQGNHIFLSTNGIGGMCRANIKWGKLNSKYDALLAANLNPLSPEDRQIMFTRCRAWIVYQGYSQEICFDNLDHFRTEGNQGFWKYEIPTGQGERIDLLIAVKMIQGENTVLLEFHRLPAKSIKGKLDDKESVQLILRPDIEDRNFHENTKAYKGPENAWPAAITIEHDAFIFTPSPDRKLKLHISKGVFVSQPEWYYMVHRPAEKERGLDPDSDLFSPGYFSVFMKGRETIGLTAFVNENLPVSSCQLSKNHAGKENKSASPEQMLQGALNAFIVKRDNLKSVIAGYPWFLDWGRDSLIFSRGLIQAGMIDEASQILKLFGGFEDHGTLPNMIRGNNAGNRDTSDAPLWFVIVCADLIKKGSSPAFLSEKCGNRTMMDILLSIGHSYIEGTSNHIRMDQTSGLIYSPAHFTWMDTNYPACTPRQGYCIEIQALWHAALLFLSHIDKNGYNWDVWAKTVEQSIMELFLLKNGYMADCLHAPPDDPAKKGLPDDSLRPNQLLAITMGAVSDMTTCRDILDACQSLLVPGAIRSLADAPINYSLEIIYNGNVIGDPHYPYRGHYGGDEDTGRKPAYHNGTAWTWLYPSYCEAYAKIYGKNGIATARSLLMGSLKIIRDGCIGHFPEILDGDYPHHQRGCDAQAWGLSEWLRVWKLLNNSNLQIG